MSERSNWWSRTTAADDADLDDEFWSDETADADDDDWLNDFDWRRSATQRSTVSGLWGRYSTNTDRADRAARVASAQKLVQGLVDTFATGDKPYAVVFDDKVTTAGTFFATRKVVISHRPLFDPTLSDDEANTILTAMATHEAAHIRYGRTNLRPYESDSRPYAREIANLLGDLHDEGAFRLDYPGFADVFDPALDYVIKSQVGDRVIDAERLSPINVAIGATRWSERITWSDATVAERDWWADWSDRAAGANGRTFHAMVDEALAHLDSMPEPENPQDGEDDNPDASGDVEMSPCWSESIDVAATENGTRTVTSRQAQELLEQSEFLTAPIDDHGRRGEVYWQPRGLVHGKSPVSSTPGASAAIRRAFSRSRSGHYSTAHGLRSGRLSSRSLTRIAEYDGRLFSKRTAPSEGKYLVWLLVDCSASMAGTPIRDATGVAHALAAATRQLPNVRLDVWGWTDGWKGLGAFGAVRVYADGGSLNDLGYLPNVSQNGTPDLAVMQWATQAIRKQARPGETPVIIMASDGEGPLSYYTENGQVTVIEDARKHGVEVLSVALGYLDERRQARVYGDHGYVGWKGSIRATAGPLGDIIGRMAAAS